MTPCIDHLNRGMIVVGCRVQQHVGNGHRDRCAQKSDGATTIRVIHGKSIGDQRTHAMTHDNRRGETKDIDDDGQPISHRIDRIQRSALAPPMPGEIDGGAIESVAGKVSSRHYPNAVIHTRTMDKHNPRSIGLVSRGARRHKYTFCVHVKVHRQPLCERRSPRPRSSIKSSGSSNPIESRTRPSPIPALASASVLMR